MTEAHLPVNLSQPKSLTTQSGTWSNDLSPPNKLCPGSLGPPPYLKRLMLLCRGMDGPAGKRTWMQGQLLNKSTNVCQFSCVHVPAKTTTQVQLEAWIPFLSKSPRSTCKALYEGRPVADLSPKVTISTCPHVQEHDEHMHAYAYVCMCMHASACIYIYKACCMYRQMEGHMSLHVCQ